MFTFTPEMAELAEAINAFAHDRIAERTGTLSAPPPAPELEAAIRATITAGGLGAKSAFRCFTDQIAPHCQAVDHERFLAFVAHPPAVAASLFDMAVSAAGIFGTSWLEAAGATVAENEALRWLANVLGMPETAGGTFLSGATIANLNALAAARAAWRAAHPDHDRRLAVAMTFEAHSSAKMVARCLDFEIVPVAMDARGRLTGEHLATALDAATHDACAVVATAGITNVGIVDDLASVADVCAERDVWFHVDAAYGGAAIIVPEKRDLFAGIERADSVVIDPHKWLFAPLDCSALLYRNPAQARAAFTQHADYIAAFQSVGDWNPGDFAMHLTRRTRGLPFWFMLATYGTDAVVEAVRSSIDLANATARAIEARRGLHLLMEPELSVVVFTVDGWNMAQYSVFCDRLLTEGTAFILPTVVDHAPCLRFCFVNPRTTIADVNLILDEIAAEQANADVGRAG